MNLTVLDCTFRDGGYYNAWDFSVSLANEYFSSIWLSGVDVVEVGFRLKPASRYMGPFAYSTDKFLRNFNVPEGKSLAVMINSSDFVSEDNPVDLLNKFFVSCDDSPVNMVRIASHFSEIENSSVLASRLKDLGYKVGFNCMQSGGKTNQELSSAAKEVSSWECVDVLYFADSLGNMVENDIKSTVDSFREFWDGDIGFHGHDNRGRALVNSMYAIENGVSWIDGTVLGMGRGAGNTRIESLLLDLNCVGRDYDHYSLYNMVEGSFKRLQDKYKWGQNLSYHIAAMNEIHPTYVQEMQTLNYDVLQMRDGLKTLGMSESYAYSRERLHRAMMEGVSSSEGTCDPLEVFSGKKKAMIIGPGLQGYCHNVAICQYIKENREDLFVINLNIKTFLDYDMIDAIVACNYSRLASEVKDMNSICNKVFMPIDCISEEMKKKYSDINILDYGIRVEDNVFDIQNNWCTVPAYVVAAYAIAIATRGGAEDIYLVGFDGYNAGDPKQEEMVRIIQKYRELPNSSRLVSVTPSTYPVEHSSIYAMQI